MSANTQTLLLALFDKFLVPYWGFFFSFLCIWDVAHLNCHPLLPNVNHFYPFSIPHIGGRLKRSARALRAQCNYLGVWPY